MKKYSTIAVWMLTSMLFVVCVMMLIICKDTLKKNEENYNLYGLPIMEISLKGTSLSEIHEGSKSVKYKGNELTFSSGPEVRYYENITLKGRGNSTWSQVKKPYQIDFNQKVDLLGMGERGKWVLLADYLDASHLRNDMAMHLANMLGEKFALRGEPVELAIDGENLGLYFLTSKIEIGENAVDLKDELGIIMELDNFNNVRDKDPCYYSVEGNCFVMSDMVNEDNLDAATSDFISAYNELEVAVAAGDYEKVQNLIDMESFAQYFLISEFTLNPDAYSSSWYMYKDGANDKIHAGPAWDFDLAFGNDQGSEQTELDIELSNSSMPKRVNAFGGEIVDKDGEAHLVEENTNIAKIMYYLVDIPEFYDVVKQVYREKMAGHKSEFLSYLNKRADGIFVAATEDDAKWGKTGLKEATDYLYDWIAQRYSHFDLVYGDGNIEKITKEL